MVTFPEESLDPVNPDEQDPEAERETIAAPIAVELDTEEAWQDFQDTQAQYDEAYAKSHPDKH